MANGSGGGPGRRVAPSDEYSDVTVLFERMNGDDADAALRDEIVSRCLPLADHVARRFRNRGEPFDDLLQVARLGLVNAVDRFDVTRGSDFLSFAVPTIMGEVRHHFRDAGWAMRVPRRMKELHLSIGKAVATLSQRLGRAPSAREIAAELGTSEAEVAEGLIAGSAYRAISMDTTAGDQEDDVPLTDTLGVEDPDLEKVENFASIKPVLARLPDRERSILTLRFYGSMTQSQIAERMGISQMHVSRILAKTLELLREELTEN